MAKLFIVGFSKSIGEIELVELFSLYGAVNTVTIVTDKETREPKGYGFVTMNDDARAERAIIALDGAKMGNRTLNVRFAEEKPLIMERVKLMHDKLLDLDDFLLKNVPDLHAQLGQGE